LRGAWACSALLLALANACSSNPNNEPGPDASTDAGATDATRDTGRDATADGGSEAAAPSDAGAVEDASGDEGEAAVIVEPSCATPDAASLDAAAVEAGGAVPQLQACMNCHGTDFSGGMLITLNGAAQYSANLTPDPATGLGCWTDTQIETAILRAIANDGSQLCVMPAWAVTGYEFFDPLDAGSASLIVQYLRSIPPVVKIVGDTGQTCATDAGVGDGATGD
jgi:hypothetical protein